MKPVTYRWIEKYRTAEHKPTTADVVFGDVAAAADEEDSERSYTVLVTSEETVESIVFLYKNIGFMFLSTTANLILFFINTVRYAFLERRDTTDTMVGAIETVCYIIIVIEIVSSVLHHVCKQIAARRAIKRRHWVVIAVDCVLQFTVAVISKVQVVDSTFLAFVEVFRLFRVFVFYDMISSTPGKHTFRLCLLKLSLVLLLVGHIAAMAIQIFGTEFENFYEQTYAAYFPKKYASFREYSKKYIEFILGGFGILSNIVIHPLFPSPRNDIEISLVVIVSFFAMIYVNGIFLGNMTSVRLNSYEVNFIYHNKLNLINKHLYYYRVPKMIRNRIRNHYFEFWNYEGAVIKSKLVDELPMCLQYAIYLDKYWFAIDNCNILPPTQYGFRRELAYAMRMHVYATGETLYVDDTTKTMMMYIHRGTVQVLSAEDAESPLVTFTAGTIIGEVSMVTSYVSPLRIVASTYCVAYCISKESLWRIVRRYRKLKQGALINQHVRRIYYNARQLHAAKVKNLTTGGTIALISLEDMLTKALKEHHVDGTRLLYVLGDALSKGMNHEATFLTGKFPWIINPKSRLLFYWDLVIVVFTFLLACTLPAVLAFREEMLDSFYILEHYINALFVLDVIVYVFVAIDHETGMQTQVTQILMERMHSSFIFDVIAVIPLRYTMNVFKILPLVRLVKIHKIVHIFQQLENAFRYNITLMRLFKYNIYIIMAAYVMSVMYYVKIYDDDGNLVGDHFLLPWMAEIGDQIKDPAFIRRVFDNSLLSAFDTVTLTNTGIWSRILGPTNSIYLLLFFSVGILLKGYITADLSATLTLNNYELRNYSKTMQTVEHLSWNPLYQTAESKRNLERIYAYLSSQWYFNRGAKIKELLSDGPKTLYDLQQVAKYASMLEKIPIFQTFGKTFCELLATKCEEVQFAKNTIFVNESERCVYAYLIDQGYCELVVGSTRRIEKTLGPGATVGILEAMLGIHNLFFVRAITCMALVRISKENLQEACRTIPGITNECFLFREEMRSTILYAHFMKVRVIQVIASDVEVNDAGPSFFIFPNDKTDPLFQDFQQGWTRFGIFRYFMQRVTIMPEGAFLIGWEICYNVLTYALITITLTYDLWAAVDVKYEVIMRALELFQLLAIYVRFHVCYYDRNGILISHPRLTGYHYLTGAFITDLVGALPFTKCFTLFTVGDVGISGWYNFNKLIFIYRLPTAFYYFHRDTLKPQGVAVNFFYFALMTITFLLASVAVIIGLDANITIIGNRQIFTPMNETIVAKLAELPHFLFKADESPGLYFILLYYTCSYATQLGMAPNYLIMAPTDVFISTLILISGYLLFTYVLVAIANSQTIINSELTLYQSHTKNAIRFMNVERVPQAVQMDAIQFYEYSWQQLHGLKIQDVLAKCHDVLCADLLYDQYKNTFDQVSIFQYLDSTIYRELSRELTRVYMLPNVAFIKVNDIVANMYIVQSGRVNVFGPGKELDTVLRCGSIFGCLDNVCSVRSMMSFVSLDSVDLLEIRAERFYEIMIGSVINELEKHILLKNISYVPGRKVKHGEEIQEHQMGLRDSWQSKFLNGLGMHLSFLIVTFVSMLSVTYVATFYTNSLVLYGLVYGFDLLHCCYLVLMLVTPYRDQKGQLITDYRLIRRRMVRQPIFYLNLLAVLPFEAIFLIDMKLSYRFYIYRLLLLTRLLRFYNLAAFFTKFNDILNSNLLVMRLLSIIVYTTLFLHFETCILHLAAVKGGLEYARDVWAYQRHPKYKEAVGNVEELICGNSYICAFDFATSLLTCRGTQTCPRSLWFMCIVICIIIVSKFAMIITVAKISACIQNYGADLARFDKVFLEMHTFLRRSAVSEFLITRILYYCEQLWMHSNGVQQPYLLEHAPMYLREQIKINAYGKHIYNNPLFAQAHPDFLRHLIRYIKLQQFFKDDVICEQGDINETMYFIHCGNVDVLFSNEDEVVKVDELMELDCFGLVQGLFSQTPHTHTFKATSVTVLCTLSLGDWQEYLEYFPATKYDLYETLISLPSSCL